MSSVALPLASCREFASNDFEAMHARLSTILKPHRLKRLSNVPVSGIIHRASLKRVGFNVLRIGPAVDVWPGRLEDFFLVQIPIRGAVDLALGSDQVRCQGTMAAVISPGEPLRLRWSDHCTQLIVQIPRDTIHSCLSARLGLHPRAALKFKVGFDLADAGAREWRELLAFAVRAVEGGTVFSCEQLREDLEALLVSTLLLTQPHNYADELRARPRPAPYYVLHAERNMREHLGRPLTTGMLAKAAGISKRTLQDGFRRFRGTTPLARLSELRLKQTRERLLHAERGTTVARVAAEAGFLQFGRFARVYRQTYGELPSETLRASRRRQALEAKRRTTSLC